MTALGLCPGICNVGTRRGVTDSEKHTNRPGLNVMVRFQEWVVPFLTGFVLAALVPREPPERGPCQKNGPCLISAVRWASVQTSSVLSLSDVSQYPVSAEAWFFFCFFVLFCLQ